MDFLHRNDIHIPSHLGVVDFHVKGKFGRKSFSRELVEVARLSLVFGLINSHPLVVKGPD